MSLWLMMPMMLPERSVTSSRPMSFSAICISAPASSSSPAWSSRRFQPTFGHEKALRT